MADAVPVDDQDGGWKETAAGLGQPARCLIGAGAAKLTVLEVSFV